MALSGPAQFRKAAATARRQLAESSLLGHASTAKVRACTSASSSGATAFALAMASLCPLPRSAAVKAGGLTLRAPLGSKWRLTSSNARSTAPRDPPLHTRVSACVTSSSALPCTNVLVITD